MDGSDADVVHVGAGGRVDLRGAVGGKADEPVRPDELTGLRDGSVLLAHVDAVGVGGVDQVGTVVEDEQRVVGVAGVPEAACRSEDLLV